MKLYSGNETKQKTINELTNIFKDHIGIENAISSEKLFFKIAKVRPEDLDYYERAYKWNSIKRLLSILRKSEVLFVITGASYSYVLNSDDELESYKNKADATIKGLHKMKSKAESWISSEELKELKRKAKGKAKEREKKVLAATAYN